MAKTLIGLGIKIGSAWAGSKLAGKDGSPLKKLSTGIQSYIDNDNDKNAVSEALKDIAKLCGYKENQEADAVNHVIGGVAGWAVGSIATNMFMPSISNPPPAATLPQKTGMGLGTKIGLGLALVVGGCLTANSFMPPEKDKE